MLHRKRKYAGFISRYQNYGVNWVKQIIGPKNGLKLTLSLEPQHRKIRKAKNMQPLEFHHFLNTNHDFLAF